MMKLLRLLLIVCALGLPWAWAQTVYGVGDASGGGTNYNRLFSVNPATGAATNLCVLSYQSAANAVSPLDGLIYYFEYNTASPRLNTMDPRTCTNGSAVTTSLPTGIIRATFCPDGRLYASSNSVNFYEIDPASGATLRTLAWSGLPANGSGDFACVSTGDLYIIALPTTGTAYRLYRASGSAVSSTSSGGTVTVTNIGSLGTGWGAPNGLTEVGSTVTGCRAGYPCLIASTGTTNQTLGIDAFNGDADAIGATGHNLTDLSRSYPVDVSITKSGTPSVILQAQTALYSLTVSNGGPAAAARVTVTDVFSPSQFSAVSWRCAVLAAGTPTAVTTACAASSGSGDLAEVVSLSVGGSVRFDITATLARGFTGTLSNLGRATLTALVTDPDTSNNVSTTATSSVVPAAHLSILKSNAVSVLDAGATTVFTISVVNSGPGDADNSVLRDPAVAGLRCNSLSCSAAQGGASCPAPAGVSISALQGGGIVLDDFPADSTVTFSLSCDVTATGQ